MDVQRTIESVVEKRTKDTYGPPVGKKLICFIDDMNMPQVDEYGTQQPIALLKLLFEKGGFYDRGKDLIWKNIKDISKYDIIQTGLRWDSSKVRYRLKKLYIYFYKYVCLWKTTGNTGRNFPLLFRTIFQAHKYGYIKENINARLLV